LPKTHTKTQRYKDHKGGFWGRNLSSRQNDELTDKNPLPSSLFPLLCALCAFVSLCVIFGVYFAIYFSTFLAVFSLDKITIFKI
jgi:hypothetical protein